MRKIPFARLALLALVFQALLMTPLAAMAQQPTPSDDEVNAIARQLYCPICENIPLDVCPTQACAQWRELIREKLAAGWSEKQIIDYFIEQYGNRVVGVVPTPSDDDVIAIAKQLFCPVCENIPLDDCDTQACAKWRELIREKLADGWSEKKIINYFIEQYGARVVGLPPAEGFNWLIYLIPAGIVILSGAFVLYSAIRSKEPTADQQPATKAPTPSASNEYIARLEEEAKKR